MLSPDTSAAELSTTEAETDGDASPRKAKMPLPTMPAATRNEPMRDSSSSDEGTPRNLQAQAQAQAQAQVAQVVEEQPRLEYSPMRLRGGEVLSDTETLKSIRAKRRKALATASDQEDVRRDRSPLRASREELGIMPRDALEAALTSQIELVQELVDERTSALDEMARLGEVLYATDNERTNLRRELDEERTRSSAESSGGGGGGVAASQVSFLRRVLAKVEASRDAARAELARVKRSAGTAEARTTELVEEIEAQDAEAAEARRRLRAEHARGAALQRALEESHSQLVDQWRRLVALHRFAALAVTIAALIALRLWLGPRGGALAAAALSSVSADNTTDAATAAEATSATTAGIV